MTSEEIKKAKLEAFAAAERKQDIVGRDSTLLLCVALERWLAEIAYQLAVKNEADAARFNFWIGLMDKIADKINAEKEKAAL